MDRRVLILVVVTLVVVAVIWPLIFPDKILPPVITRIEATQLIKSGTIITAKMVKEVRVKMVEGEEVEVDEEEALPSVAEAGSTKLDQVVGTIATERIEKEDPITSEAIVPLSPWSAALYLGKEVISFYADIDEALGGILRRGSIIDMYAYHPVQEDEATQLVKISPCILVVDSHGTSGSPARWPIPEAAQAGGTGSILGGGGAQRGSSRPASLRWQLIRK